VNILTTVTGALQRLPDVHMSFLAFKLHIFSNFKNNRTEAYFLPPPAVLAPRLQVNISKLKGQTISAS
jgi:hypothetical protein